MKFSCEKALLSSAVTVASRAVAAKSSIPAMEGILIEAGAQLKLTGYNLETGIQATVPAEIKEGGSLVLSARLLGEAVLRVYPLVAGSGVPMPQIKLRKMRSQWGNCHYRQGYITLNTALARCPEFLRDYVALHELVHFLHHDHGPGFYAAMDARMPDWRDRRQTLKQYAQALAL